MMTCTLLKIAYQLRHHGLGDWSLDRWGTTAAVTAAVLILLQWALRDMPPVPALHWATLLLIILVAFGLAYLQPWAGRQMYIIFSPDTAQTAPAPQPLDPADKVLVHASALFEVEGKSRFFAGLLAYWRTFASREHAVMAIVHRSRFLLLGSVAERNLGMWYLFFTPDMLESVTPGTVTFGAEHRRALRIAYRRTPPAHGRKPAPPITQVMYLGFADEDARVQVWADLLADG